MITVDSLTKKYAGFTTVDDVSFTARAGRVTGFLGPNGAGKSTTMRVMVGLTPATSGEVTVAGRRFADLPNPGREVGVLLDASAQHAGRTGREILAITAAIMGLPKSRVPEMLHRVSLTEEPEAEIPVVQLSINALKPLDYHVDLGRRLAPLRERGVLIVGSGNVVHNLRRVQWDKPDSAFDWAERFDDATAEQLESAPGDVLRLVDHPDYALAVPTPDHFIPLLYIAGVAAASGEPMEPLIRGYAMGSLSMSCYDVGTGLACREEEGAATIPEGVPADQSNI